MSLFHNQMENLSFSGNLFCIFPIIWKLNKGGKKSKKKKSRHDGGHAGEHHATKEKMRARKSEHEHRRLARAAFIYRPDRNETPVPENQNLEAKPGG